MRVITGSAKGIKLKTLEGLDVRPTTDRVKEGMFSAVQFDITNARILDLFAGSGQLGIEALSRGAKQAVFVDQSAKALSVIKENLKITKLIDYAELYHKTAEQYLQTCPEQAFDMIFLDAPYRMQILEKIIPVLDSILKPNGKIIAEHEIDCKLSEKILNLYLQKEYFYGKIVVSVFTKITEL
ncbi:MAG: 16S rRNA (guanine(966)-N(2))-methyltransferase RsmD [Oscillospiraceae bacterium]|nr:16S rRNA (guanine(966)-N(2))-methyltransferase RsmD [Oscillospiraceae bacterium]